MRWLLALVFGLLACLALGQGGPPLLTDDPGTVDRGRWELNLAWINRSLRGRTENDLPHFDLNHGLSNRAHFKVEVPWVVAHDHGDAVSGEGGGSVGVKYRFIDGKGHRPAVSTYPQVGFSLAPRSVRLSLAEAGTSLLLPIQVQWDLDGFSVNADAGALFHSDEGAGWIGGVAIGRGEFLAELHSEGVLDSGSTNLIAQLGLRHDFSAASTLLFAFGKSLVAPTSERLIWTSYLGVQLRF